MVLILSRHVPWFIFSGSLHLYPFLWPFGLSYCISVAKFGTLKKIQSTDFPYKFRNASQLSGRELHAHFKPPECKAIWDYLRPLQNVGHYLVLIQNLVLLATCQILANRKCSFLHRFFRDTFCLIWSPVFSPGPLIGITITPQTSNPPKPVYSISNSSKSQMFQGKVSFRP